MITDEIRKELFALQDKQYQSFQAKLLPTVKPEAIIGVRTPALRSYARRIAARQDRDEFLRALPHIYFDENQLHAFVIAQTKEFHICIEQVCRFLPYVDNWATCDQLSPKVFKKCRQELFTQIRQWINSDAVYTVRFAVGMLMEHFLDEDFDPVYPQMVAHLRSDEYYINMMIAWYFATALAKQYEQILPFIEEKRLDTWTHNKAIQKALESRRILPERKEYLGSLKVV